MSFNKALTILSFAGLIFFNVFLCYFLLASKKNNRLLKLENVTLTKRSSYMLATYKQALDLDMGTEHKDLKVGVYLNLIACGECNMQTIAFIKKKFKMSELIFFVDDHLKSSVGQLDLKDADVRFVNNDRFFLSNSPFFFLQAGGVNVMKYTHDNNFPELTVTYITKIQEYVKSMNRENLKVNKSASSKYKLLASTN